MKTRTKKAVKSLSVGTFRYVILGGLSFLILYPLIITLLISFMNTSDIYDTAVRFISQKPSFENYRNAILFLDYWKTAVKSVAVDALLSGIEVLVCLSVAYGFARFNFPFRNLLFICVMATLLIPYHIYFAPLYISFRSYGPFNWNLLSTSLPMYLFSFTAVNIRDSLLIYILRQSFKSYPKALEEAASVDGANSFKVFTRIMLPGAVAPAMTCFMFSFVWKWTDPTYSDVFFSNKEFLWTMMANIESKFEMLSQRADLYYRAVLKNASVILFIIPLVILFMICKRFLVESIETTGLVG